MLGLLLPLLVNALLGCSSPEEVDGCFGDVDVSVIRSNPPSLSWEPGCGISNLAVIDAANETMWLIHAHLGENTIVPPVRFGVVPDGALEEIPSRQLQHGNSYIVRVFRLRRDARGEFQLVKAGEKNFPW